MVIPVVTYGLETMGLTKVVERKLDAFENNILRRICEPIFDEEERRWKQRRDK